MASASFMATRPPAGGRRRWSWTGDIIATALGVEKRRGSKGQREPRHRRAASRRVRAMRRRAPFAIALALVFATVRAEAPEPTCDRYLNVGPVGSATEDLGRVLELAGATPLRPQLYRRWSS